jgi:hypothetical protein
VSKVKNYCSDEKNFKVPVMKAIEQVLVKAVRTKKTNGKFGCPCRREEQIMLGKLSRIVAVAPSSL